MARKSLGKKIRFEVFKRDSFKCQYCGRSAPDVVLEADHIHPVSAGGEDDIINLITACFDCNSGKSDRLLSDDSVLAKQRDQLQDLQERREQLEMMIQWKEGLSKLDDETTDRLIEHWIDLAPGWRPTDEAIREFKKIVKKFGASEVIDAMITSAEQCLVFDGDKVTRESWGKAWSIIPGICRTNRASKKKPYLRDLYYIRGILRKRLSYVNDHEAISLMEECVFLGVSVEQITDLAKTCGHWTHFKSTLQNTIEARQQQK